MNINDIHSPADIRKLGVDELRQVAADIRTALITKLSRTGGHVGPNLGMVEATIALHYVFDSPRDKIVFDVSHQCYTHKMLTGRVQAFLDPAHYHDVTGYTEPRESDHDFFTVGHTSTSVSLACGLAKARDLKGGDENIIAVIGDGSLSGGEAFEGLDAAAELHSNFIVVVNDNDMAIAENHGGLYDDLRRLRETNGTSETNYFRSLGYDYRFVPMGNDLQALIDAFRDVRGSQKPVVVHIVTEKGEGYKPAEEDKEKWHYEGPFEVPSGIVLSDLHPVENFCDLTCGFLLEKMKKDPTVVTVTSATPTVMGFTRDKREEAGDRFVDVGIAEEHAAAFSSGLAKAGMNPVWGVWATFVQRAYDQISQDICINGNPATILVFGGGGETMTDVTHLCWFDIAMLSNIPGLLYLAPADRREYLAMADWAVRQREWPVAVRVPSQKVFDFDYDLDTNYADVNTSQQIVSGKGLAIISVGNMLARTLEAVELLKKDGITPTVINARFLNEVDKELLSSLSPDHNAVLTVEDGIIDGGYGQKAASFYADTPMLVRNLGLPKEFHDRYDVAAMMDRCHLTPAGIAAQAREMFK